MTREVRDTGHPRRRMWGRAGLRMLPVLSALLGVSVLFLAVFPTRTYLDQRRQRAATEKRLQLLETENRKLEDRSKLLLTDSEIERIAREQYNLVRPGEEAYALLPSESSTTTVPGASSKSPGTTGSQTTTPTTR